MPISLSLSFSPQSSLSLNSFFGREREFKSSVFIFLSCLSLALVDELPHLEATRIARASRFARLAALKFESQSNPTNQEEEEFAASRARPDYNKD